MKVIFKSLLAVFVFGFIFSSCKKKIGDNEKIKEPNESVKTYMSTKEGSWWMYASRDGVVIKRHATGRDSTMMGFIYNLYSTVDTNSLAVTPEFFAKNEDKYTMLIDMDGTQSNYIVGIVQKDSSFVGDSWTNTKSMTYSGIPVDLLIEGEVKAINQTITINGNTFKNVTEVKNVLKAKTAVTPYVNCGHVNMWFSKGVGVIKTDFNIDIMSIYTRKYVDSLINYHIAP